MGAEVKSSGPDVSVVIVSYNTRELTTACIRSVREQTSRHTFEIIVIDNASSDGSAAAVRDECPDVILIENTENNGFAAANNQGIRIARGRYYLLLNPDTVILDDAIVTRLADASDGAPRLLLVVNASNSHRVIRWLESQLPASGVQLTDRTAATAMIAAQGPLVFAAEGLLRQVCGTETASMLAALPVYGAAETMVGETPAIVSRTGYTGEDGVELVVDAAAAVPLWERLLAAGRDRGVQACGLGSRDTLRLEAGMPLYGHELTEMTDPFAIGLGRAIELEGRTFPGVAELSGRRDAGGRQRVGLQFDGKRAARQGDTILLPGTDQACGAVTSGSFSPTLGSGIALAMVEPAAAVVGTELEANVRGSRLSARVVSLPFYRRPREAS